MNHREELLVIRNWLALIIALAGARAAEAQQPASARDLATRLAAMTAVTGFERAMVDSLLSILPGSRRDRAGNAVLVLGAGEPRRLLACPLDEPGYVVGGIDEAGYLTLRRIGRAPTPLFDQQLEGHRVTIWGRRGAVPGVVAVRSTHLTRGRSPVSEEPFTVDNAYVDVGVSTPEEAGSLGIRVLTPVALTKRPHRYGIDLLAAPAAGRRGACAALVAAGLARQKPQGTVVIGFTVEQNLGQRGLLTAGNESGPFDETVLLGAFPAGFGTIATTHDTTAIAPPLGNRSRWLIAVRYPDTAVETVALSDVDALARRIVTWMGGAQ